MRIDFQNRPMYTEPPVSSRCQLESETTPVSVGNSSTAPDAVGRHEADRDDEEDSSQSQEQRAGEHARRSRRSAATPGVAGPRRRGGQAACTSLQYCW